VIYEWAGENYSAYAPDLPGCVAAGDTIEETERLMREAIELYFQHNLKDVPARTRLVAEEEVPKIVCSEAFV